MKFGLKLWSINDNYRKEAIRLYKQGIYYYIELYAVPRTYDTHINLWKDIGIPFVVHAPHFREGLNLAKKEKKTNNMLLISETIKFADTLRADKIIVHPGTSGDISETVHQLEEIDDRRILIENKPYYAIDDGLICNGASVEEIKFVLDNVSVGFCLDIGHAICSANAKKVEPFEYLKRFMKLNPIMYHLTDGDYESIYDRHAHFGTGNYDIEKFSSILPEDCFVTIETLKDSGESLSDFEADIRWLRYMRKGYRMEKLKKGNCNVKTG